MRSVPGCIPEQIGGQRNWDYRYAWLRDFAFSIFALSRLGFTAEATAFNRFRQRISNDAAERSEGSPLDVMYRIDGGGCLAERELEHLERYGGSRPVRIGNSVATQPTRASGRPEAVASAPPTPGWSSR